MIKTLVLYGCIAAPWLSLDAHAEDMSSLTRNALAQNDRQIWLARSPRWTPSASSTAISNSVANDQE
jgi:hypothetical protein